MQTNTFTILFENKSEKESHWLQGSMKAVELEQR